MIKLFKTLVEISELLYQIVIELQDLNFNLTHYATTKEDLNCEYGYVDTDSVREVKYGTEGKSLL